METTNTSRGAALLRDVLLRGEDPQELLAYLARLERVVTLADRMRGHELAFRNAMRTRYRICERCSHNVRQEDESEPLCPFCRYAETRPKTITTGDTECRPLTISSSSAAPSPPATPAPVRAA